MYLAFAEHRRKAFEGLGGLGEYDYSADRAVEPVRDAHEYLTRLAVTLRDEGLEGLRQAFVACPVSLDDLACPLVHDQQVVVLVQDPAFQVPEFFLG